MIKTTITLSLLALTAFEWQGRDRQAMPRHTVGLVHPLKEESMTIEYTPARNEAVVRMAAESESALELVEIRSPRGEALVKLGAREGEALSLSGYKLESYEVTVDELFRHYAQGRYDIRAMTIEGQQLQGSAVLSHELLQEPAVLYPRAGSEGVPCTMTVGWIPDPKARAYVVNLEQDENDGLQVKLPPGSQSLQIPPGVLSPGTETQLEVGAIAENGNVTLVEVLFTTR